MILPVLIVLIALTPFERAFVVDSSITLPPDAREWVKGKRLFWNHCAMAPSGERLFIIDPNDRQIATYDLNRKQLSTIVKNGRKKDRVVQPLSLNVDTRDRLLISDAGSRRVLILDDKNELAASLIAPSNMQPPHEIHTLPGGNLLFASLRFDQEHDTLGLNLGDQCTIIGPDGAELKSFAYTPQSSIDRNLWKGISALTTVDDSGHIFVTYATEYRIEKYDSAGKVLKDIIPKSEWFVPPPALRKRVFEMESAPADFWQAWTRILRLFYLGDGRLLVMAETNNKVPGADTPFILDILDVNGAPVHTGIPSNYYPVGVDRNGSIYFISFTGETLLKTHLWENLDD
jgi:hypothetical protein